MGGRRVGLVDLDTSHPAAFLPIVRELGHEVVAVCDGGAVHDPGYAERFAAEHGIPLVCATPEDMVGEVDIAFVHGCDWDTHVPRVRPFVEAGVPVLVDKPFAGRVDDLRTLLTWAEQGAQITGGSSLRWCTEVTRWRRAHAQDPAEFALVGCSGEEFDYGIHAYSLLHGLFGPGVTAVRWLGGHGQRRVELRWADGRTGMVSVGPTAARHPFHATVLTAHGVEHLTVDPDGLYAQFLRTVLPYLAAGNPHEVPPPLPLPQLVEPELAALAALVSEEDGGRWVDLDDPALGRVHHDGAAFARRYRESRRGQTR
ncbi:MAG TPA: Gfo/Idh/MocA family oxidoreductase [Pseudonocardiaceae bacterium]